MRFYTKQHKYYCGIDLHARVMYVCILNTAGDVVVHRNMPARPEPYLKAVSPYRDDLVVAAECMFTWYWLADLCEDEDIPFVLGHALYMKAIHGGKVKNDRVDSHKIAARLRGGTFPMAYVYPRHMRSTRDLLRRRTHFVRKRAELLAHIHNTTSQYNLPPLTKLILYRANREGLAERFPDPAVAKSIEVDVAVAELYDRLITDLELTIMRTAKQHDGNAIHLLRSVPGVGKVLSMTILYEIGDIGRFPRVQDFVSYCRLIKPPRPGVRHEPPGRVTEGGRRVSQSPNWTPWDQARPERAFNNCGFDHPSSRVWANASRSLPLDWTPAVAPRGSIAVFCPSPEPAPNWRSVAVRRFNPPFDRTVRGHRFVSRPRPAPPLALGSPSRPSEPR